MTSKIIKLIKTYEARLSELQSASAEFQTKHAYCESKGLDFPQYDWDDWLEVDTEATTLSSVNRDLKKLLPEMAKAIYE